MANKENSLAHTKWMCKYHIVFTPKYRRKVIYNQFNLLLPLIFSLSVWYWGFLKGKSFRKNISMRAAATTIIPA